MVFDPCWLKKQGFCYLCHRFDRFFSESCSLENSAMLKFQVE
ncbi:hypothetical protein M595_4757 [Lyngbya aestuarii BL J]|uniref:Uncharacterized protein n=1 Tax=Lyngbya aestuarii BL J TaxID=1348334 RepID=U7QFR3_9CYAN|nr:hypothetical protein M595_4757 [Lyngbya aestuarii BL J]